MANIREVKLRFQLFGKTFGLICDRQPGEAFLKAVLPVNATLVDESETFGDFRLITEGKHEPPGLYYGEELLNDIEEYHLENPEVLDCKFQYALAEALSENWVFLHSGAVSYNGSGIVFPGNSRQGKSTLTKAFLDAGAEYLSDDCAVIDSNGKLHSYPLPLKLRIGDRDADRNFLEPSANGFKVAEGPLDIKCVLFTGYDPGAAWEPTSVTEGRAVWMMLEKAFYVPAVRLHPQRTLDILSRSVQDAILLVGERNEAGLLVEDVIRRLS